MILLDTHVLFWLSTSPEKLTREARRAVSRAQWKGVADITLWELANLTAKGRIRLDRAPEVWIEQALEEAGVEVVAIDADIAVRAQTLAAHFHGDPADRLIAATAQSRDVALVTAAAVGRMALGESQQRAAQGTLREAVGSFAGGTGSVSKLARRFARIFH